MARGAPVRPEAGDAALRLPEAADCEARTTEQIKHLTPPEDATDDDTPDDTPRAASPGTAPNDVPRSGSKRIFGQNKDMALTLHRMMGVDLTAIPTIGINTALVIAAEIGPDFSAFPSAQHFSSWLGLAPGTRISGGKPLPGRGPKVVNRVGQALRMAAMTARTSKIFIGAKHRGRLARMDTAVAVVATARELACLIYLMVTCGQEYAEKGMQVYKSRHLDRKFSSLRRQASKLGYQLVQISDTKKNRNAAASMA